MKIDIYTKFVLTIIAICLTIIAFKNLEIIPNVSASSNKTPLEYYMVPINEDGTIDVNVKTMSDEVDVNIEEVGGYWVGGSTLPVEIK